MALSFLHEIILQCLAKLNGERSIYAIYHLLNGKKSSQTIQDAHLFQLDCFFNTDRSVSRRQLEVVVADLEGQQLVDRESEQIFRLTEKGIVKASQFYHLYPFISYLHGWKYKDADLFWARLNLLVQVVSNLTAAKTDYLPIQKNKEIQGWLKKYLHKSRFDRNVLAEKLYDELEKGCEEAKEIDPAVLIIRLTGHHTIGLTSLQASEALQMEPTFYHYQFTAFLHQLIAMIQANKEHFPLLYGLVADLETETSLTESTNKTYHLLQKGYSLEEIAIMRRLKMNTIYDHLVELAVQIASFDIAPYVDQKMEQRILQASRQTTSKQLKNIRALVQDANYFEIRLVMAKHGVEK